jgi:hypothetical protein
VSTLDDINSAYLDGKEEGVASTRGTVIKILKQWERAAPEMDVGAGEQVQALCDDVRKALGVSR